MMLKIVLPSVLLFSCICGGAFAQTCAVTNTFSNGSTADASAVNTNFANLANCAVNASGGKLTGGTLAGTTTLPGSGTLTSAGVLGLGTSTPSVEATIAQLVLVGAPGQVATTLAQSNTEALVSFRANVSSGYTLAFGAVTGGAPYIQGVNYNGGAASSNIMLNPFGGFVGIGTTAPTYELYVSGTAYAAGAAGALSDIRHKDKVEDLPAGALALVEKLRPVSFFWKEPKDDGMKGKQMGFIAQEMQEVLPSVVLTENNKEKTLGLKYNELIAVLTKAVQEEQEEIIQLKSEVSTLKAAR